MYKEELLVGVSLLEDLLGGQPINREKLSDKEYAINVTIIFSKFSNQKKLLFKSFFIFNRCD